jgi:hypothetical protein
LPIEAKEQTSQSPCRTQIIIQVHQKNDKVPFSLIGVKGDERGETPLSESDAGGPLTAVGVALDS